MTPSLSVVAGGGPTYQEHSLTQSGKLVDLK